MKKLILFSILLVGCERHIHHYHNESVQTNIGKLRQRGGEVSGKIIDVKFYSNDNWPNCTIYFEDGRVIFTQFSSLTVPIFHLNKRQTVMFNEDGNITYIYLEPEMSNLEINKEPNNAQ